VFIIKGIVHPKIKSLQTSWVDMRCSFRWIQLELY